MITVNVSRKVIRPSYQNFTAVVELHGFDRLTPQAARAALEIVFGGSSSGGEVWWNPPHPKTYADSYGYRVYAKSARKITQWDRY